MYTFGKPTTVNYDKIALESSSRTFRSRAKQSKKKKNTENYRHKLGKMQHEKHKTKENLYDGWATEYERYNYINIINILFKE